VERRAARLQAISLILIGWCLSCEDRRLAMDAANAGGLREVQAALACRGPAGYPRELAELSSQQGSCPAVAWISTAKTEPEGLRYAGYQWHYWRRDEKGVPAGFEVVAIPRPADARGCPRCRSFWLSEAGEVRWARGHAAGPQDPVLRTD
jgi:hypothetical protein